MGEKIRWGILGTGQIAHLFAEGLRSVVDASLVAVGSRSQDKSRKFASLHNIPHPHGSFEALVNDQDVDVVYIASPHHLHRDHSLLALNAGKAVLCEKPFTVNARQAQEVIDLARSKQLFCMEAMWMRFLPAMRVLKSSVDNGFLGGPAMLSASFGSAVHFDMKGRQFDPSLAGGALLDLGVYPVSLACQLFGEPLEIVTASQLGQTGVDEFSSVILKHKGGNLSTLQSSLQHNLPTDAVISGTKGIIKVHSPLYRPHKLSFETFEVAASGDEPAIESRLRRAIKQNDLLQTAAMHLENYLKPLLGAVRTSVFPFSGNGYNYEAAEVNRCIKAGKLESDIMSLEDSLKVLKVLDQIRAKWGLRYPVE